MRARILIVLLALVCGCRSELVHSVDEHEANAIVRALDASGIGAWKERSAATYRIEVSSSELPRALSVLEASGLPRENQASLASTFGETSLIVTPDEERARLMSALSGELSCTLALLPGVQDARVHIALPAPAASLDAQRGRPTASVLLRMVANATVDETSTRELIAHAVEGLDVGDIHISRVPSQSEAHTPSLENVGPFSVARGSSTALAMTLAVLLMTNVLLAAGVGWLGLRANRQN